MKIGITERGDAALDFDEWFPMHDTVDGLILITKDPALLLQRLRKSSSLSKRKCIVHCTITGWGGSILEPNAPPTNKALDAYKRFIELLGPEHVVLRVDPIIPTVEGVLRAHDVYKSVAPGRIRISFLDLYKHVRYRLKKYAEDYVKDIYEVYGDEKHAPLELRKIVAAYYPKDVEICGEPGLQCTGCVSGRDLLALNLKPPSKATSGQRLSCACLAVKTELLERKHPCGHNCLYCYWC